MIGLRIFCLVVGLATFVAGQTLELPLRSRVEKPQGSGNWEAMVKLQSFPASQTAIIVCDMWDKHWCSGATRRVQELTTRMNPFLDQARAAGIQIVHAPSETMDFYKDMPQRLAMIQAARIDPPPSLSLPDPPLPIDDKSGGCDTGEKFYKAWTRENPAIAIAPQDRISDNGAEVYSLLRQRGIRNLLMMGVHANMCILNRGFAIKQMTRWGVRCILVRDLTDSMYDPKDRPYVSHQRGTELVIEHIEKYWAPTAASSEIQIKPGPLR